MPVYNELSWDIQIVLYFATDIVIITYIPLKKGSQVMSFRLLLFVLATVSSGGGQQGETEI